MVLAHVTKFELAKKKKFIIFMKKLSIPLINLEINKTNKIEIQCHV
jgi:hypothetical protein